MTRQDILNAVRGILAKMTDRKPEDISEEHTLAADIGIGSGPAGNLEWMEFAFRIFDKLGEASISMEVDDLPTLRHAARMTLGEFANALDKHVDRSLETGEPGAAGRRDENRLAIGTRVRTTTENTSITDWSEETKATRKWGVNGQITAVHDSRGLYYDVRHEDGSESSYDASELETV